MSAASSVVFRLGMIPAIALSYLADRIGRRGLLMATLAGATVATVWTAFAQDVTEFVAAQTLARVCIYTEELLCVVVIAEEFGERTRGWAIGQLAALAALGAGVAALVFGFVNLLPFGWRAIYLLGAIPLLWLLWARRGLVETKRFQARKAMTQELRPLKSLLANYPDRLVLLICVAVPYAFGMASGRGPSVEVSAKHAWLGAWPSYHSRTGLGRRRNFRQYCGGHAERSLRTPARPHGGRRRFGGKLLLALRLGERTLARTVLDDGTFRLPRHRHHNCRSRRRTVPDLAPLGRLGDQIVLLALRRRPRVFGRSRIVRALSARTAKPSRALTLATPLCLIPIWFLPEPAKKSLEDIAAEREP